MRIDFPTIEANEIANFKDGDGSISMQAADDGRVRIMRVCVHPSSSIGLHRHVGNCEVVYIVSGKGKTIDNGEEYDLAPGSVTYCPEGREHTIVNTGEEDLVLFAVIPSL